MKPCFAIIMPVYNRERFIENALQSVAAQSYRPIRLIIADNGSTDNSMQVAHNFRDKHSTDDFEIIITEEEKPGACAARNRGLKEAGCDYLMFFDDDDLLAPDAVSRIMDVFTTESPDIVGFTAKYRSEGKEILKKHCFTSDPADQINHCMLATQCFAVKKEFLEKSDILWDEELMRWQDWNLGICMLLAKPTLMWIKSPALVTINTHGDSISGKGFLHSEKELEKAVLKTAETVNNSRDLLKEKYKKLIYSRLVILAAHYRREGDKSAAKRSLSLYMNKIQNNNTLKLLSYVIYLYTAWGGRGGGKIFKIVFNASSE